MNENRLSDYLDHMRQAAMDARGFVDCTSFAAMERMKLPTAFGCDQHFSVIKYAAVPGK